jgi:hypothetical protein
MSDSVDLPDPGNNTQPADPEMGLKSQRSDVVCQSSSSCGPFPREYHDTLFKVRDVPFDGSVPIRIARSFLSKSEKPDLSTLPTHKPGTARIFDVVSGGHERGNPERAIDHFLTFVRARYGVKPSIEKPGVRPIPGPNAEVGVLAAQWTQELASRKRQAWLSTMSSTVTTAVHMKSSWTPLTHLLCSSVAGDRLIGMWPGPC